MNLESSLNNLKTKLPVSANKEEPIEPQVVKSITEHVEVNSPEQKYDNEELALAKAPTLMLELEEDENSEDILLGDQAESSAIRYYIHGVVMGQRACLITNLTNGNSQTLFQAQMVWTIGRNREAALPLRERSLSRRHAVILYLPQEGFYLVDLNSMNGTFLNGVRVQQRQLLHDGDHLRMGSLTFNFFASNSSRTIDPLHPEVLARFVNPASRSEQFMDYAALEEPEILFKTKWDT